MPLPLGEVAAVRLTERVPSQSRSLTVPAPPKGEPRVLRQIKINISAQRVSARPGELLQRLPVLIDPLNFLQNSPVCGAEFVVFNLAGVNPL